MYSKENTDFRRSEEQDKNLSIPYYLYIYMKETEMISKQKKRSLSRVIENYFFLFFSVWYFIK